MLLVCVVLASVLAQTSSFLTPFPVGASRNSNSAIKSFRMGMDHLKIGSDAPAFSVKDQDGAEVTLSSFKGQKNVIVYFYPKDATPGCTKEACTFRDLQSDYDALDCVVLGVSADSEASHQDFIADLGLNFSLLADTDKSLINAYGAMKAEDENKIQRSTVVIDKEGKVAAVWNPVTAAEEHPVEVLEKIKGM
ncbi:unnamed protein product [Ectocarpus sp. CCAP 1310/34]|nr:unnamed protein product [Ectocarpus sp. CCAP 1310/34]